MQLQDMLALSTSSHAAQSFATGHLVVQRAMFSIPDTLFIFVVALVVFGPKRLPEIGKQIGKLVFEFRRASNDFKLQIEEELRLSEQQERQKTLELQAAASQPATPVTMSVQQTISAVSAEAPDRTATVVEHDAPLTIQPPSSGLPVSAPPPNRPNVMTALPGPAESNIEPTTPEMDPDNATAHHG